MASLFSDFLTTLGVPHTTDYSDKRFAEMTFKSMFGLSALLNEYGVATVGVKVPEDQREGALASFPVPFLADTPSGFAIVKKVKDGQVCYATESQYFTAPVDELLTAWNGIALLANADSSAAEPNYRRHRIAEIADSVKVWILGLLAVALVGFAMYATGLYAKPAAWAVVAFDGAGIWLSWQLILKSLGIKSKAGDAVCSALEEGGCDEIARSEASSFMGIFKWSEVGMAYFSVSLAALLLFPSLLPVLAAINILCLPYTIWSITYQKFVAKTWCTLCVCVQATLWLLFFSYLLCGATGLIFPITGTFVVDLLVLGACYITALLGLNRLDDALIKRYYTTRNDTPQDS